MMLSDKLIKSIEDITAGIKESREYRDFEEQKKIIRTNAEARGLIEHARTLQKRLMDIPEEERNSDYAESLQDEYEEITENTVVYDYSRAESAYVTMLQEVLGTIIENADIEI